MNPELDFAKMSQLIGKPQVDPQPAANPFGDIQFGPLMAMLLQHRRQQNQGANDDAQYRAGFDAADQYLKGLRR